MSTEDRIIKLESRVIALEAFIMKGQINWINPDDMIIKDGLIRTIKDTINREVSISVNAELRLEGYS